MNKASKQIPCLKWCLLGRKFSPEKIENDDGFNDKVVVVVYISTITSRNSVSVAVNMKAACDSVYTLLLSNLSHVP